MEMVTQELRTRLSELISEHDPIHRVNQRDGYTRQIEGYVDLEVRTSGIKLFWDVI
jgi:hypothetical protein